MFDKFLRKYHSFKKDKKGVTAIEFAMIAPLLLFLTFGTLEMSFYNYLRANVENRTHNAARQAMAGYMPDAIVAQRITREQYFIKMLRDELKVAVFKDFKPTFSSEIYETYRTAGENIGNSNNRIGGRNEIVKITITATYDFMTPLLGLLANNINQFKFETSVFMKNEIF